MLWVVGQNIFHVQLTDDQLGGFMKQSGMATSIPDLPSFPLPQKTYAQLVQVINSNQIILAVMYDPDARDTLLNSDEKMFTTMLGTLMFIVPVTFLVGAIWIREWFLLMGVPGFLIAAFVSNPWARGVRRVLMVISIIGATIGFWKLWILGVVFAGLLFSLWLAVLSREYINAVVRREVMKSETLFCYTFQTGLLLLKDTNTGRIHGGR